jgi:hypothetical protein
MSKEVHLHIAICLYIKEHYPDVIFTSESSGIRVPISQARQLKKMRSCSALPDIWIAEPRKSYRGLFLEVKKKDTIIYKKDGSIRSDPHLIAQENILHNLQQKGYLALFVVGYDNAIAILNYYLND